VKTTILALSIVTALAGAPTPARVAADPAPEIIALERKALDGLAQGNPDTLLALSDADISYFHVMTGQRLDGASAVKSLVEPYRGRALFESYEMIRPRVQVAGDVAVLTYILLQRGGGTVAQWNGTQVYQRKAEGWRIVHTHWSQTAGSGSPSKEPE
jgi:ketosteroid isomerase-like protein